MINSPRGVRWHQGSNSELENKDYRLVLDYKPVLYLYLALPFPELYLALPLPELYLALPLPEFYLYSLLLLTTLHDPFFTPHE